MAATDMARPRTRLGNTSEQKSQPIGPIDTAKAAVKSDDAAEKGRLLRIDHRANKLKYPDQAGGNLGPGKPWRRTSSRSFPRRMSAPRRRGAATGDDRACRRKAIATNVASRLITPIQAVAVKAAAFRPRPS